MGIAKLQATTGNDGAGYGEEEIYRLKDAFLLMHRKKLPCETRRQGIEICQREMVVVGAALRDCLPEGNLRRWLPTAASDLADRATTTLSSSWPELVSFLGVP